MIDVTAFTQYAQCRVIYDALVRAGNRQAQIVQDAFVVDLNAEHAKYYDILETANQAQLACDRALLAIAQAVVAGDQPSNDVVNILRDAGFDWSEDAAVITDIVAELRAITEEAR
jgi:hypothetical protein